MLVEDVATGERQRVAADLPVRVGREIGVQGGRLRVTGGSQPDTERVHGPSTLDQP